MSRPYNLSRALIAAVASAGVALFTTGGGGCASSSGTTTTDHGSRSKTLVIPDGDSEITSDMVGNWHPKHGKGCVWSIVVPSGKKRVTMASGNNGGHAFIFHGYIGGVFHSSGCRGWR
jgi:hypothetical protein